MAQKREHDELPEFPALQRCLLTDARHQSRTDIVKDLKSSSLFQEIIQAKSLADALTMLSSGPYDACFVGPSISVNVAADFLKKAREQSVSQDCAFLAFLSNLEDSGEQLCASGAHNVIRRPCTKSKFTLEVAKAVIRANANSPWASILLSTPAGKELAKELRENKRVMMFDRHTARAAEEFGVVKIIGAEVPSLRAIAQGIEDGSFGVGPNGKPTAETAAAIKGLVGEMLKADISSGDSNSLEEQLEAALMQWFIELNQDGKTDATAKLKTRLLELRRPA